MALQSGLDEAFKIAKGGQTAQLDEGASKLLAIFLREGDCNAAISDSIISAWYSWLPRPLPSKYSLRLAPGLVSQLMRLGKIDRIVDEATFQIGPGTTGTGRYVFDFQRKWVRIRCEDSRITISIRDDLSGLNDSVPESFSQVVRCERCNGKLQTPLARQCLHCGLDWH